MPPVPALGGSSNFNPPAPCGAGQKWGRERVERLLFQPTRPVRGGTTVRDFCLDHPEGISTHPPRAGRDRDAEWLTN